MATAQVAGPLLVIAGAGTGKTNTLAHRVAHLILAGADPRRILLMTFSRRAAVEMKRRIERIAGAVLGDKAATLTAGLTWAGTFHSVAPASCASTPPRSASIPPSPSTTAATPPT